MNTKFKEIFKLKKMLEEAEIPFDFKNRTEYFGIIDDGPLHKLELYQICYPSEDNRWISVIEGNGTYGSKQDKLEIMGGFTPWEMFTNDISVIGGLTARNVFKRIKNHYEMEEKLHE